MILHQLSKYVAPHGPADNRKPGIVACTCTAFLEDAGLTKAAAKRWFNNHDHHEPRGARDLRPVLEHDFRHVQEVAARIGSALPAGSEDRRLAWELCRSARVIASRIAAGDFATSLRHIEYVPRSLGRMLASIDPERAR